MKLLLISNSGRPYLQHCRDEIRSFLGTKRKVCLIAAAPFSPEEELHAKVSEALAPVGIELELLRLDRESLKALNTAEALMVTGGNTYRLLKRVREAGLLPEIRRRVGEGLPYIGWSAGSNLTGPTILTTNDWNVVGLTQFAALGLVPFNINPHYLEVDPGMAQFSETRAERIGEYHKVNSNPVAGIEEQTGLRVEGPNCTVFGAGLVHWFEPGVEVRRFKAGQKLPISIA